MQHDPPDSTGDEFSVRLSWPKVVAPTEDAPAGPAQPQKAAAPLAKPASPGTAPAASLRTAPPRPGTTADLGAGPETGVARAFIDAFDRLSDRLLDRLRVLRQDLDADLSGLRTEVAALRQAVEDNTHGGQLRQLQSSADEVRSEVAGLRRAVLEWPELERVSDEVSSMRGDLSFLFENTAEGRVLQPPSAILTELEEVVGRLSEEVGNLGPDSGKGGDVDWLVDEIASIRTQLSDLSRRMPVAIGDDPQLLSRIADAVTERLLEQLDAGGRRTKRR